MAFRTQKISQMTPKGADLEATDLIEVSTIESGSYVTRSITGQELIDAIPLPPTGLTVGTTPISSGTIGRVLFQGTGNVLQQSSSLFWDSTNNRLGIGTSSPTFRLEVQGGDVRFANGLTIGTAGSAGWQFSSNTVTLIQNGFVSVDFANGREFSFTNASFSTTYLKLASVTGNVLINTTTDAGFRLDVNGTARVSGLLSTPLGVNLGGWYLYANGTSNASMFGGSSWIFDTVSGGIYRFRTTGLVDRLRIESTGNILIGTTTDAGFRLDVNGTARVKGTGTTSATTTLTVQNSSNSNLLQMQDDGVMLVRSSDAIRTGVTNSVYYLDLGRIVVRNGDALGGSQMQIGSNLVPVDSAVLDLNSTTRGFLPPRMTTTQKNAIASPAAGLQVYDTTLNQMSYYNGTTWTNI